MGVFWLVRRRAPRAVLAVALGCVALGALRAEERLLHFDAEREQARDAFGPPQRCALQGRVDTSPTWVGGRALYTIEVESAECESGAVAAGTRVRLGGGPDGLRRGDRVAAIAQLAPIELLFNADLGSPLPFAARRGVVLGGSALSVDPLSDGAGPAAWIDRARASVRRRILATFAPAAEPMARALVLGENDLDPDDGAAFRKSGLSHMLAVSGTHLVFAVVSIVSALTALLVRIERFAAGFDVGRASAAIGVVLALVYADFAGGSGSAYRAAFMLSAAFAARAFDRAPAPSRSLGLSVLIGWLGDPLVAFDLSFLLSFAATAGLLLFGKAFAAPCERLRSRLGRALGTSIGTTLAAMLPCAPLLALLGSDLTLAGVFANVLAAPLGEMVALPLCLLHAAVSAIPPLEHGVGLVASGALLVVRQIAHESAAQTWLSFPMPDPTAYHLALAAVLAAAVVLARGAGVPSSRWQRAWVVAAALGVGALELAAERAGAPPGELRVTALAVGQGDATLIDFPNGQGMLIDAGGAISDGGADPGERVVVPVLRARRRDRLDVVVLSHPHPDHFGGLLAVVRAVEVGELWDSGQGEREGAGPVYRALLAEARARGIPVRGPAELCGRAHDFGGAVVRVLAPCPGFIPGRDANDNSIVIRVEHGAIAALFTGDAEAHEEADLLAGDRASLRADLLKVGHHGSRTSTSAAFLDAVRPRLATVSCGTRNRFGHPTPEVVARLAASGVDVHRTDRRGSAVIRSDGAALTLTSARAGTPSKLAELVGRARRALTQAESRALFTPLP